MRVVHHHNLFLHLLVVAAAGVWWVGYQLVKWFVLVWWYLGKWTVVGTYLACRWLAERLRRNPGAAEPHRLPVVAVIPAHRPEQPPAAVPASHATQR